MNTYINPGNVGFQRVINSPIYIDKSTMIDVLNQMIGTNEPLVCVSRPRRFGKSVALNMLTAYYSRGCDSKELFQNLDISKSKDFGKHLNRYDVIRMDIQWMVGNAEDARQRDPSVKTIRYLQEQVIEELDSTFPGLDHLKANTLAEAMRRINGKYGTQFVVLIDELDSIFRNYKEDTGLQKEYIEFLRSIFKGVVAEECVALAYMTGILPVKKYGTESALNNFKEYTMINPSWMSKYVGFTEDEVKTLCELYMISFDEVKRWYNGYHLKGAGDIYNPRSVVETMLTGAFGSHWTSTGTYESVKNYIMMVFDGLRSAVTQLIAGNSIPVNTAKFQNDMTSMNTRDDVLSLLIHLGYLGYDQETKSVFIPNEEVKEEFVNAIEDTGWNELIDAIENSKRLLENTLEMQSDTVADASD